MRTVAEQTPIMHILQPLTITSLLAIIFGSEAPLSFITDGLEILGGAMVPSVMLMLGGMLAEGPNESKLGRTMIGSFVMRLLIVPLIGSGIVSLANKLNCGIWR